MKLDYIDALRGMAILSVIWFHCHLEHFSNTTFYSLMDTLGSPAAIGVQLFYALSAFTLFLSQDRRKGADIQKTDFFYRRFFRIAPMYYVAIPYYLWQMAYFYSQPLSSVIRYNVYGIMANMLLLHGLSPVWINSIIPGGWSVGIEVLFYAMVPFLFTRITNLNRAILFTVLTLLVGFVLTSVLLHVPAIQNSQLLVEYLFYYLPYQLPVFGCGIVAYYVVIRKERRVRPWVTGLAVSVVAFLILSKTIGQTVLRNLPHTLHLFGSIGFAVLIIVLAKWPSRLLVNRVTRYIGKVSYSAYLTHFGILYWLNKVLPKALIPVTSTLTNVINFHLKFVLILVPTVLFSSITYHLIEEPAQQVGKQFLRRRKDRALPAAVEINQ
ncbi:acyltransferase [Spirosoma sp. RP8]|uniref:Acyltransferase n=1 Tax=Spirosoma liriopis TaxID=2937440 RepID=A0ABT0HMH7_9BACT|nr:acyltransferase [Spirosoma liriopis]MCK8493374.1 acyltransferase [Spirosoma liriopis]